MGTALITGSSRGIGAATAIKMSEAGWDVAINYQSRQAEAESVAERCRSLGVRAHAFQADVSAESDVERLFSEATNRLGPITALVNNAGIVGQKSEVADMTVERIVRMFAVNAIGPFLCCRSAVRQMSTAKGGAGGVIVNVSSVAARLGSSGEYVDYAAAKAAVDTMTVGLAKEVADQGIRVNCLRPGLVDTEIHASGGQPDRVARFSPVIPLGRAGTAEEIANGIAWLCSNESSYMTGSIVDMSGGR